MGSPRVSARRGPLKEWAGVAWVSRLELRKSLRRNEKKFLSVA
jgi:hypothetical protein